MIKVIGHRGFRNCEEKYENTLPAFEHSLKTVNGLETDVVASADGEIFFIHDVFFGGNAEKTYYMVSDHLDEKSTKILGKRHLSEMVSEEIKTLKLKNGGTIPLLSEFIDTIDPYPHAFINIELKSNGTAIPVTQQCDMAIEASKIEQRQILISSFNYPELLKCKKYAPSYYKIGLLTEPSSTTKTPMYSWLPDSKAFFTPFSEELLKSDEVQKINPWSINMEESDLMVENVQIVKENLPAAQIIIWWWYPEPPPEKNDSLWSKLEALKKADLLDMLYAIITDYPMEMKTALNNSEFQKLS